MANRVGKIVTKVLRKIKQKGQHEVTSDDIIAEMESIQLELARKYLAIKGSGTLSIVAATATYALTNVYKIRDFVKPTTWTKDFEIVHDTQEWSIIKNTTFADLTQPQYGFIWNNTLDLFPVPTVTESVSYFYYGLPIVALTYEGDPETGQEWDDCYENELIFRENGDMVAHQLYLERARELSLENFKESVAGVIRVASSSDQLGF